MLDRLLFTLRKNIITKTKTNTSIGVMNLQKLDNYITFDNKIFNKWKSYIKLLRIQNCMPTLLLNFLSGWITFPSYKLFLNRYFWVFSLITQLTMMNSMVVNDLFDLKIDSINNKNRPLVTKEITIKEAKCFYIYTNIFIAMLSLLFFKKNNFYLNIFALNIILLLYTPYLKKIIVVKNITCAFTVASTILLTSKSIIINRTSNIFNSISSNQLIDFISRFLFLSSLYIELLLDIKDINGDKENNVITIPNYFGVYKSLELLIVIFMGNLIYYCSLFYKQNNYKLFFGFLLSNAHFLRNLISLRFKSYSEKDILNSVNDTTISLVIFILFILQK
jgi:4-hydroxybenzoate polyprenyltransferase